MYTKCVCMYVPVTTKGMTIQYLAFSLLASSLSLSVGMSLSLCHAISLISAHQ